MLNQTIASVDFFRNANNTVSYRAGETIYHVGTTDDKLYAIQSGEVDLYFKGEVIETVGTSGIFGEKSLIDNQPHTTTAVAKSDTVIVPVEEAKFLWLIHETPTFALQIMRVMASRLRAMTSQAY